MNEDFLHYVWKFQKFSSQGLITTQGEPIQVLTVGTHNFNAGPDFLCGQVVIDEQLWAGAIEMHLQSSHWYTHRHEKDTNYDNVILHVVWEHDVDIRRSDETIIPTLELKGSVATQVVSNYQKLFFNNSHWINCEHQFAKVDEFVVKNWLDRLFLERLEQKSQLILDQLAASKNNWEEVLFRLLCKNFGLKVNGASFLSIAQSIDYKVIKKSRQRLIDIEALLMGQANLLEGTSMDLYHRQLKNSYAYSKAKFGISNDGVVPPKFFRLRPPNFPTIRLSQFAMLLHHQPHLFSEIISTKNDQEFYNLFSVRASEYWDSHYNFEVTSAQRKKKLTKKFMDLLLINTVIPLKHSYAVYQGKDNSEEIIQLATVLKAEENSIVKKYRSLRDFKNNALESQGLLQLKNNYCDKNKCLQCAVGNELLKNKTGK